MISNNKKIAIHQPNYLPWLGYFYKIYQCDVFVFLDDVQFSNEGMHNYTYIKTERGPFRLKYPVQQSLGDKINEVTSKDELGWKDKHLKLVEANYRDANYFKDVFFDYKEIVLGKYSNIVNLNITLIEFFSRRLGLKAVFTKSSELNINLTKTEKIINICKLLDGKVYFSGSGAKVYQKEDDFSKSGIELQYSIFKPFAYRQLWGKFQSNVSAMDFFMNCGYDWEIVLKNQLQ